MKGLKPRNNLKINSLCHQMSPPVFHLLDEKNFNRCNFDLKTDKMFRHQRNCFGNKFRSKRFDAVIKLRFCISRYFVAVVEIGRKLDFNLQLGTRRIWFRWQDNISPKRKVQKSPTRSHVATGLVVGCLTPLFTISYNN